MAPRKRKTPEHSNGNKEQDVTMHENGGGDELTEDQARRTGRQELRGTRHDSNNVETDADSIVQEEDRGTQGATFEGPENIYHESEICPTVSDITNDRSCKTASNGALANLLFHKKKFILSEDEMKWDGKVAGFFYKSMNLNEEKEKISWWKSNIRAIEKGLRRKRNSVVNDIKREFMGKSMVSSSCGVTTNSMSSFS